MEMTSLKGKGRWNMPMKRRLEEVNEVNADPSVASSSREGLASVASSSRDDSNLAEELKNAFDEPGPRKLRKLAVKENTSDDEGVVQPLASQETSKKDLIIEKMNKVDDDLIRQLATFQVGAFRLMDVLSNARVQILGFPNEKMPRGLDTYLKDLVYARQSLDRVEATLHRLQQTLLFPHLDE